MGYYYQRGSLNNLSIEEVMDYSLKRLKGMNPKGYWAEEEIFPVTGETLIYWGNNDYMEGIRHRVPGRMARELPDTKITRAIERHRNSELGKAIYVKDCVGAFHTCWASVIAYDADTFNALLLGQPPAEHKTDIVARACRCNNYTSICDDLVAKDEKARRF
jgi:hypothetical protein